MIEKVSLEYNILNKKGNSLVALISDKNTQRFSFLVNKHKIKLKRSSDWIRVDFDNNYFIISKTSLVYYFWNGQKFQEFDLDRKIKYINNENQIQIEFYSIEDMLIKMEFKWSYKC
jgi:hypothetical protein